MTHSLVVNVDSIAVIEAALARRALVAHRSFDLRSALSTHSNCGCPHHGTAHCTCQFTVWLIYGSAHEPVVLTAHSHDNRTEACIVRDAMTSPDPELADIVMAALSETVISLQAASVTSLVE